MIKTGFLLSVYLLCSLFQAQSVLEDHRFAERLSVEELQEDFAFFRGRLERYHPGLYTYATGFEMDSAFATIEAKLDHPMSDLEFYQLLSPLKCLIKDGHTYFYPNRETSQKLAEQSALPFNVFWDWENLWVTQVYAEEPAIKPGDKILSINGITAKKIAEHLMANIIRDGENDTYPRWIMNQWFDQIYHNHYEGSEQWVVEIESVNGQRQKLSLPNQPRMSVPEEGEKPQGIHLRYEGEIAILKVPSFNGNLLKERYQQKFRAAIKEAFVRLEESKTERLILDLRDNQGGEINNGRYFLSFLLEERFAIVRSLKKVVVPEQDIDNARLKYKFFSDYKWTKPQYPAYEGELVVLINGGSFSCSGAVSAQLEASNRGLIIGEESGGNRRIFCGVGPEEYLPHSRISLAVPRVQFQVVDLESNLGMGVVPNNYAVPSISDLLTGRDMVLTKALALFDD